MGGGGKRGWTLRAFVLYHEVIKTIAKDKGSLNDLSFELGRWGA